VKPTRWAPGGNAGADNISVEVKGMAIEQLREQVQNIE
jgi:uncharacterized protein YicC (UPF0701 family)